MNILKQKAGCVGGVLKSGYIHKKTQKPMTDISVE